MIELAFGDFIDEVGFEEIHAGIDEVCQLGFFFETIEQTTILYFDSSVGDLKVFECGDEG